MGIYVAVAAVSLIAYFTLPQPAAAVAFTAGSILPLVGIAIGLRINGPRDIRPWLLLAAGQAAFLVADVTWFLAYLPAEIAPAIPHVSDLLYLTGYPLLAGGVVLFIRARQPRYRLTAAIDALLIGVAAINVLWLLAIDGVFHDETLALAERGVLIAYPIGDVIILSAAAYLLLSGRQAKGAFYMLVASLTLLWLGDLVYPLVADETLAANLSDGLWMISYALFGLTALVASMRNLTERSDAPTAPEATRRLVLIGAVVSVVPAFAVYQKFVNDHQDLAVTGISGAIVIVAILIRMRELAAVHSRIESRYASLLANASDAFAIISPEGVLQYASPASKRVLGYEPTDLVGRSALDFVHPRAVGNALKVIGRVSEKPGNQADIELSIQRAEGNWRWLSIVATNRMDDPVVSGIVLNFRDVTERRADENRIDMQARVLDEVQHAVMVTDSGGRVSYWNHAAEALFGWQATEVVGRRLSEIDLMADPARTAELVAGLGENGRVSGEYELRRRDGTMLTALLTNSAIADREGHGTGMIAVAVDISDRKQLEQRLQVQAFTDALTGLANRSLFLDRVAHVISRGNRVGVQPRLAVLFLDLDDFKTVNDSMGHIAGDQLLKTLADRLTAILRPSDTAARLGGDEFAVLLEDSSVADAELVAQRLLAALAMPVRVSGLEVTISASIGIAVPTGDETTAESLLRDADLAMYRAKAVMQGSYTTYQPGMHEAALRRMELKADLQRAIETDGLALEYQPIVRLRDGVTVAAEALLRWTHPERGPIPVAEILALAEATGLMLPVGAWVLNRACGQVREWRTELGELAGANLFVSVNASARELLDPAYPELVASILAKHDLPAAALAIEITESDLMQESELATNAMGRLKELGVRLAIDDFGTGYSSLAYLARFPLDVLKIDRMFVSSHAHAEGGAIARAIVDLAASLGLEVIAEGIETEAELLQMAALGAQLGQGFYLSRPTSANAVLAKLRGDVTPRRSARSARAAAAVTAAAG